jgi:hypothetical protein
LSSTPDDQILLKEHEYGYSTGALGFPSISGCRAVIYHTANGIFGLHQYRGPDPNVIKDFGDAFGEWVDKHRLDAGNGIALHVATYLAAPQTQYNKPVMQHHVDEMKEYARGVGFRGRMYSYNLSAALGGSSAYVEARIGSNGCEVFANTWVHNHDKANSVSFDTSRRGNHQMYHPNQKKFIDPGKMIKKADTTGIKKLTASSAFSFN